MWYSPRQKKWENFIPYFSKCISTFNVESAQIEEARFAVLATLDSFFLSINGEGRVFELPKKLYFDGIDRFASNALEIVMKNNKEKVSRQDEPLPSSNQPGLS